jgi:phosphatidylserine decarboxylase
MRLVGGWSAAAILALLLCAACGAPTPSAPAPSALPPESRQNLGSAGELRKAVESDPELKRLLTQALEEGRRLNPDPQTNPAQTLEQYYAFVKFAEAATPANLIKSAPDATLYKRIDQSLGYLYFISDIPLDELKGRGYFNNSLQYVDSYNSWLRGFVQSWGLYLDQPESWNAESLRLAQADEVFGLKQGWYESPDNWKSFNQFFARRLASPDKRPIAAPRNDSVFISPVDAVPMGTWSVDKDLRLVAPKGVAVKTATVESVEALLDGSPYAKSFAGGTFTHLFLDVGDYHRYHFPMSGTIWEMRVIPGRELAGGFTTWDAANKRYKFDPSSVGWQSLETRGLIVLQTDKYGLVALMPVGMSPVSSVNFEKPLKEGSRVTKGDMMGHFLFGGSDFIVVFQRGVKFTLETPRESPDRGYRHVLMGERVGELSGAPR